jgi:type I restriction enzyme S subunit
MTWRPYPKYRPSGLQWIPEIPEHWEVRKLKHIATIILSNVDKKSDDGEIPVRLCNYTDVYYNDYITSDLEFMEATATQDEIGKFKLVPGDVLITKDSEEWSDIAVPAHVPAELDGVLCGYHLALIRPRPEVLYGGYLFRAFAARGINDQFRVEATGITRYGLGKYPLDNALFPVPPVEEQRVIAAFLDRKTKMIYRLVAKIEQLGGKVSDTKASLLREYKIALISAAVTGKIDVRKEVA